MINKVFAQITAYFAAIPFGFSCFGKCKPIFFQLVLTNI